MNITFFCSGLETGGAERVITDLSNYLIKKNNVSILTLGKSKCNYTLNKKIKITGLGDGDKSSQMYRIRLLLKYFQQEQGKQDIYVAFLPIPSYLLIFFKRYVQAPMVISIRTSPEILHKSLIHRVCMSVLFPKADGLVFQTDYAQDYYKKMHIRHSVVIPNAINPMFFKSPFKGVRKKTIVSVGRLEKVKNHSLLINAFKVACERTDLSDYTLIIYGDGSQRFFLEQLILSLGLQSKVFLPGANNYIYDTIHDASLFILTSLYEGMPNALLEAMALGLPIISTHFAGGAAEFLIQHKYNGILIEPNNPEVLAQTIITLLKNPTLSQTLGMHARERVEAFAPTQVYNSWENYLNMIIQTSRYNKGDQKNDN